MEELILNSYTARMHRLTSSVRAVLVAPKTGDAIETICQKHGVEKRVFSYAGLVGLVLMGELSPSLLVKNIIEKENIDTEKAKLIALDISAAIFQPIKQDLIAMYGLTPKPPERTETPVVPQKPPEHIEWKAPPSTRESGTSLPEIPVSTAPPISESAPSVQNTLPSGEIFYSPAPVLAPQNNEPAPFLNPGQAPLNTKPNIVDLSKEPPRPVAQPGDPPLEGNIVNLKDINTKPSF